MNLVCFLLSVVSAAAAAGDLVRFNTYSPRDVTRAWAPLGPQTEAGKMEYLKQMEPKPQAGRYQLEEKKLGKDEPKPQAVGCTFVSNVQYALILAPSVGLVFAFKINRTWLLNAAVVLYALFAPLLAMCILVACLTGLTSTGQFTNMDSSEEMSVKIFMPSAMMAVNTVVLWYFLWTSLPKILNSLRPVAFHQANVCLDIYLLQELLMECDAANPLLQEKLVLLLICVHIYAVSLTLEMCYVLRFGWDKFSAMLVKFNLDGYYTPVGEPQARAAIIISGKDFDFEHHSKWKIVEKIGFEDGSKFKAASEDKSTEYTYDTGTIRGDDGLMWQKRDAIVEPQPRITEKLKQIDDIQWWLGKVAVVVLVLTPGLPMNRHFIYKQGFEFLVLLNDDEFRAKLGDGLMEIQAGNLRHMMVTTFEKTVDAIIELGAMALFVWLSKHLFCDKSAFLVSTAFYLESLFLCSSTSDMYRSSDMLSGALAILGVLEH